MIFIDFETRSCADLPAVGGYAYAKDHSTTAILLAYRLTADAPTRLWQYGQKLPADLIASVKRGNKVAAWNVQFDRWIWNESPFGKHVKISVAQSYDVMSQAAIMGLPLSLAKCGAAIGLTDDVAKDARGAALIRKFCCPPHADMIGNDWEAFKAYAIRDVDVLVLMHNTLDKLTKAELRNLHTDMYVNERGLPVDYPHVLDGMERAATLDHAAAEKFAVLTDGLKPTQVKAIVQWINDAGWPCTSIAKAELRGMLEDDDLPPAIRAVLEIRKNTAKASVAKLKRMRDCSVDGRVMGCHQHHAATTGRAGGRLVQTQNLPRPTIEQDEIHDHIASGFAHATLDDISSCLRGLIAAPRLVCSDWSNIEGRVLPWLAGEQWKLEAFKDFDAGHGDDIYKIAASKVYHCEPKDIDKAGRQIGKVIELACGFGGGLGAFSSMADIYGVEVSDKDAQDAINAWRTAHPKVVRMWAALDSKAKLCAQYKVDMAVNEKLSFSMRGEHLYLRLPSGRELCYPYARVEMTDTRFGERRALTFYGKDTYTQKWGRCQTFGGRLAENCWTGETLVRTLRGVISIKDVHKGDRVWDGAEWVKTDGAVAKGVQEVGEWLGTRVTAAHQIYDGAQWNAVTDLGESGTDQCLYAGRSSAISRLWKASCQATIERNGEQDCNAAKGTSESCPPSSSEKSRPCASDVEVARQHYDECLRLMNSLILGRTGTRVSLVGAATRRVTRMLTMGGAALQYATNGVRINSLSSRTRRRYLDGPNRGLTLTASTMNLGIFRGTCAWLNARLTHEIAEQTRLWSSKARRCAWPSLPRDFSRTGSPSTASSTTTDKVGRPTGLWRSTTKAEKVYDLLNCGERSRFAVVTPYGDVIAHNCTQAVARDVLYDTMQRLVKQGNVPVMHVHDEVVIESSTLALDDLNATMCEPPTWADGLPLAAEGWSGERYRK